MANFAVKGLKLKKIKILASRGLAYYQDTHPCQISLSYAKNSRSLRLLLKSWHWTDGRRTDDGRKNDPHTPSLKLRWRSPAKLITDPKMALKDVCVLLYDSFGGQKPKTLPHKHSWEDWKIILIITLAPYCVVSCKKKNILLKIEIKGGTNKSWHKIQTTDNYMSGSCFNAIKQKSNVPLNDKRIARLASNTNTSSCISYKYEWMNE